MNGPLKLAISAAALGKRIPSNGMFIFPHRSKP